MFGPTVTNGATLTRVGVPEFELYYAAQHDCPAFYLQRQTQFLIKYAFSKQWMLMVGSNGLVRQNTQQGGAVDFADPQVTLKYLVQKPTADGSAQALQFVYKAPFGDPARDINTGEPDYHLYWIYSRPLGEVNLDFNLWLSSVGADDGSRRLLVSESAALTVPISDNLSYQGEVYHYGGNGPVESVVSTLHGLRWNVSRSVSLAVAVDVGLNANAPRISYIVGGAFHFGRGPKKGAQGAAGFNPIRPLPVGASFLP